jgi:hypothetical protein
MKNLIVCLILLLVFMACNPQNIRRLRKVEQKAQPDSFLFYQPTSVPSPFLDSLNSEYDEEVILAMRLIPPPLPPAPKTKQVDGFRVQLFAGLDSINAAIAAQNIRNVTQDTVYFFKEKGLYKVQIGDYLYRNPADMKTLDLRKEGFMDGWVVQRLINVPIDSVSNLKTEIISVQHESAYAIQILVTSDRQKAERLVQQLKESLKQESYFTSGTLFKVFVGKFDTRQAAESVLQKVKEAGYKDAWIVY